MLQGSTLRWSLRLHRFGSGVERQQLRSFVDIVDVSPSLTVAETSCMNVAILADGVDRAPEESRPDTRAINQS